MGLTTFKDNLAQLNDIIHFDQENFLREKTSNPARMQQFISEAEALLVDIKGNKDETYFLYGTLGNLYRINGDPKKAIVYLERCLEIAKTEENSTREVVSLIRLGEALKYDNQHEGAMAHFDSAYSKCIQAEINAYLDFVFQHQGKCLLEMGKTKEALECFQKALKMREQKGNASLIKSTQQAIAFGMRCK